jgi:hypothetical protein
MYLVGEYVPWFTLLVSRNNMTWRPWHPQPSSMIGTTDYDYTIIADHFACFPKAAAWPPLETFFQKTKNENLTQLPFSGLMQWRSGERIERITKAQ